MVEIRLAAKILDLVLVDGKRYIDAVDEVFPTERKTFQSSNISVLLAKESLKHYFLYEHLLQRFTVNFSPKQKSLFFVILTNNFYLHLLSKNNCNSFFEKEIPESEFVKAKKILEYKGSLEELISFEKDSDFYYATKYNVPIWLIHMWRKHYGDELVNKFLEASIAYNYQCYVVNSLKTSTEVLLKQYPDFSSPFEDMLIFNGTKRYQLTDSFKNYDYIDVKIGFKTLIDEIFNPYEEVLLYSGYDDDFAKTMIIKTQGKQGLHLVVPNLNQRVELMKFIRTNKLRNINFFEAKDEYGLKAGVTYKQSKVVVFPLSTRFDIVSKYPDFLLHFDRDDLDGIIQGEKDTLELCSKWVDDDGELVYVVNTLNKKESTVLIKEFLENHPDFSLEKEEQEIASDPFMTTMYYAVLRRGEKHD